MAVHRDITLDPRLAAAVVAMRAADSARGLSTRSNGTQSIRNSDGTRTVIGAGAGTDGAGGAVGVAQWVGDTTAPGKPTGLSVASSSGVIVVTWDGTLDGGVPSDFDHITVYLKEGSADATVLGTMNTAGSLTSASIASGTSCTVYATAQDAARLEDGTLSPNVSAQSDSITVTVTNTVADVDKEISEQNSTISGIQGDITDLTTDLGTVKTTAKEAKDTADEVSDTLSTDYSKTGTDTSYVTASTNLQTADEIMQSVSGTYATQETVSTVSDAAAAAQSTADKAQSTAEDAWSRTLRVQVSSSPADAAGDTSSLTATVWRGGEQLSDETVARMGLLAWYVGGSRVATGSTYTCAAGTATESRLEA